MACLFISGILLWNLLSQGPGLDSKVGTIKVELNSDIYNTQDLNFPIQVYSRFWVFVLKKELKC